MRERPLSSAAKSFLAAYDAYLRAHPNDRDQRLVRDLCNAALEELVPGSTTEGDKRHPSRYKRRPS